MTILTFLQLHQPIFLTIIGFFGLAIGSFLNVVIYRLPIMLNQQWQDECSEFLGHKTPKRTKFNLATPASHCPSCKQRVKAWQNIPIISYLFLLGRCPNCKTRISSRYPIVEFLSCVASVVIGLYFGVSWLTLFVLILTWALIVQMFIDIDHMILPDGITLPLLWLGLLVNLNGTIVSLQSAVIGAIVGYLALWLVAKIFKLVRGMEGMGHGDFKLLALFGAWLGWQNLPFIILAASIMGLIVGIYLIIRRKTSLQQPIPFGPYLIIAGWAALLWGPAIYTWYLNLIGVL